MHVGYSCQFNNPYDGLRDAEVWERDLSLYRLAEPLGFDGLWTVEHHFTSYNLIPDPLGLLSYMAGVAPTALLGTQVVVAPWYDPIRLVERIVQLDNISGGRLILGLGRGLGRIEYEGFGIPMDTSRERFTECLQFVAASLEQGFMEWDGEFIHVPRRDIRPGPIHSFKDRLYVASMSPDAMPLMARLGVGLMQPTTKPWKLVKADSDAYTSTYEAVHGRTAPRPIVSIPTFVDGDPERAKQVAHTYFGMYNRTVIDHYEFLGEPFGKGYEFYNMLGDMIRKAGVEQFCADFADLCIWGTPEQVYEKVNRIYELIGIGGYTPIFSIGGMPLADAEASMRLFAAEVLPALKQLGDGLEYNAPSLSDQVR